MEGGGDGEEDEVGAIMVKEMEEEKEEEEEGERKRVYDLTPSSCVSFPFRHLFSPSLPLFCCVLFLPSYPCCPLLCSYSLRITVFLLLSPLLLARLTIT